MKYIKTYEGLNEFYVLGENIDTHGLINWNLIRDTKDMALEYIDEGHTLIITIRIISIGQEKKFLENTIYYLYYNHDVNREMIDYELFNYWSKQNKNFLDDIRIEYSTFLDPYSNFLKYIDIRCASNELKYRVKLAYPNENIS